MKRVLWSIGLSLFVACPAPKQDKTNEQCMVEVTTPTCDSTAAAVAKTLQTFTPPTATPGGVLVTATPDAYGLTGFPFQQSGTGALVDGWEVTYSRIILVLNHITLSNNPDRDVTDPTQTDLVVSEVRGPFVVDLLNLDGQTTAAIGGVSGQKAIAIALMTSENQSCGTPALNPSTRYAFNYELTTADYCAKNVNLKGAALDDFADMVSKGYTAMVVGTATFKGTTCSNPAGASYTYTTFPKSVTFRFGFKDTLKNANCENPVAGKGAHGFSPNADTSTSAQITLRNDLLLAQTLATPSNNDANLRWQFDQIAARYADGTHTNAVSVAEDFATVAYAPFADLKGAGLPWRSCVDSIDPSTLPGSSMSFETGGTSGITAYADFLNTAFIRQMRFNGVDGACTVEAPSPNVAGPLTPSGSQNNPKMQ